MPPDEVFLKFLRAVAALRQMEPRYRSLAHHAADFWDSDEFVRRVMAAPFPESEKAATAPGPELMQ